MLNRTSFTFPVLRSLRAIQIPPQVEAVDGADAF